MGDEFVIRAKLSRLSSNGQPKLTPKGKISKALHYPALVDKKFTHQGTYHIDRLTLKNKNYQQISCALEWEELTLEAKTYCVVRITLRQGNKPLFQQPMLLITNRKIKTAEAAKNVYHAYTLRFNTQI